MRKTVSVIFLVLSLTLFTGYAFSEPYRDNDIAPSKESMDKVRKRIETLKMWKLTEALSLNEETAAKFFPVLNKYDRKRMKIGSEMKKDMLQLRQSVDTASENELEVIILRLRNHHKKLQEISSEELSKLRDILSVRDMGRLILFKRDFKKDMRKRMFEVREKRKRN